MPNIYTKITKNRCMNIDSYMERLISTGVVLSRNYFLNAIRSRTKKIIIAGQNKSLRDLSLKYDRCCFFYGNFISLRKNDSGYWNLDIELGNKIYKYSIYEKIAEKTILAFQKSYSGDNPNKCKNIMAAGFIYRRVSRKTLKDYYTIGRVHLFKTTTNEGIYCSNNIEFQIFNSFFRYKYYNNDNLQLYIPVQAEDYTCMIKSDKRCGYIFQNNVPKDFDTPEHLCIACHEQELELEKLKDLIDSLK